MKIAVFGNRNQSEKVSQLERLFLLLKKHNARLFLDADFYEYLSSTLDIHPEVEGLIDSSDFYADIALSVGGDGTFLRTAQRIGSKSIPILGINTGHLGFLADITPLDMESTLVELFKNYYRVEERSLLTLSASPCLCCEDYSALNEISISKREQSSLIQLNAYVDGEFLTTYRADGLIISTPTGSTAYSMSVGGPLLMPSSPSLILSPIASHTLNVRPLVISDQSEIEIRVEGRESNFLVSLDGRSFTFDKSTKLTIRKADYSIKVIKRHNHNFFETLRNKLHWGGAIGEAVN
ncbi:MAG: NAD kinase [Bacteroidales bacterium]